MSDDLYHPGPDADDDLAYGDGEGFVAAQEPEGDDDDDEGFAERMNEAIVGDPGDPAANLAVAGLLAKLAERTNDLQNVQNDVQTVQARLDESTTRLDEATAELAERTADLQRLQAEYVNYRRRVERDRAGLGDVAKGRILTDLLPVVDDIGRAREHGELEGGFRSVAESLESILAKLGLEKFGTPGEPFDPNVHEALMHQVTSDVPEDTCVEILQPGYRLGERVLRVARVTVAQQPGDADE